jgi:hypothetical protein
MNGLVKPSHMMERTDKLYRRAAELQGIANLHERKDDDDVRFSFTREPPTEALIAQREEARGVLAKLESLSRLATREEIALHIGAFLSRLPNAVKDEAYVNGLAGDVHESQPSIGVLELGLRTLRLNRKSTFIPATNEVLRALARAARERQQIIWRLGKRDVPLECYAEKMFDPTQTSAGSSRRIGRSAPNRVLFARHVVDGHCGIYS